MGEDKQQVETEFQMLIRLFREQTKYVRFQDFCDWYEKQKEK